MMKERNQIVNDVLERRYINRVLQEQGEKIMIAQDEIMQSRGFSTPAFRSKNAKAIEEKLEINVKKLHRFVDMKTRKTNGVVATKKSHPIYNRIIFGHMNNIIFELQYGFTEAVKEELRKVDQK